MASYDELQFLDDIDDLIDDVYDVEGYGEVRKAYDELSGYDVYRQWIEPDLVEKGWFDRRRAKGRANAKLAQKFMDQRKRSGSRSVLPHRMVEKVLSPAQLRQRIAAARSRGRKGLKVGAGLAAGAAMLGGGAYGGRKLNAAMKRPGGVSVSGNFNRTVRIGTKDGRVHASMLTRDGKGEAVDFREGSVRVPGAGRLGTRDASVSSQLNGTARLARRNGRVEASVLRRDGKGQAVDYREASVRKPRRRA
jgi:hypothetical protein